MPKYGKGLFLFNGNDDEQEIERKLNQTLPVLAKGFERLFIVQTADVEQLRAACEEYAQIVDAVIILGGDGTIHECINVFAKLDERPAIGILPGGTCNDFSRMLHIPQNLSQAAQTILDGDVEEIDIGKADDQYFLNFWGIGLVAQTSMNIDSDQKRRLGVLSYFLSTLRSLNQAEPFPYTLTADGEEQSGEAVMILVMNGRFIGTREIPLQQVDPRDGKLDLLIVKNSNLTLFKELMMMNQGDVSSEDLTELSHIKAKELRVESETVQEIDMDGEIYTTTPSEISIVPGRLKMIVGSTE
ncbi:YegS/Rv2252/BmrU family lipid kinase [Sediminibacillus massiliensis]|uniref:YegS/Rv2252/BmrU family lipid kinase n=1 Tax=Sediminibacillus massiliensis TaxID=1926277 RepID=UPI0009888686|nr:YegS/Rv2252/BmrU family lipid kinase [Sediminibacillus massiliensis]